MSKISSKDTKPEILVRKFLFSKGFRYRINVKTLPGKPDGKSSVSCPLKPSDSAPLKHSTMPP